MNRFESDSASSAIRAAQMKALPAPKPAPHSPLVVGDYNYPVVEDRNKWLRQHVVAASIDEIGFHPVNDGFDDLEHESVEPGLPPSSMGLQND